MAKVRLRQVLLELREVQVSIARCLGILHIDVLRAATFVEETRLLGLARRLVNNVTLEDAAGLHSSNAREYLHDLIMAAVRDLPVQQQLVHFLQRR